MKSMLNTKFPKEVKKTKNTKKTPKQKEKTTSNFCILNNHCVVISKSETNSMTIRNLGWRIDMWWPQYVQGTA